MASDRGAHGAPSPSEAPPLSRAATVIPSVPVQSSSAPEASFVAFVRAERWADARAELDALPEARRSLPELRFVHARVAFELGDAVSALCDLAGLEPLLPVLAAQIGLERARAQLKVGPYAEAAQYFEQQADSEGLLSAASAYSSAGAPAKAYLAVEHAFARLGRSQHVRDAEVRARLLRAELSEQIGDLTRANADLRWLALSAPLRPEADQAVRVLDTRESALQLSKSERMERASAFAEAGRVESLESEIAAVTNAAGAPPVPGRLTYLRAFAQYVSRGDYEKAAALFERAAREDPGNAAKSLFFAARALSRAQLSERAIEGYERLARQFPKSDWAEQAQYLAARLRFIAGEFVKARAAYDVYLAKFGKRARFARDAVYERALSALETDQAAAAAVSFGRLAERAAIGRDRARLGYLEALALSRANQKASSLIGFLRVAREQPLSFFGLAARSRLRLAGAELPPLIAENHAPTRAPLELKLPLDVALLNQLGLARDAERELFRKEAALQREYAPRGSEALCEAYGLLGVAARRYRLAEGALRAQSFEQAPSPATEWAWRCLYPSPYSESVKLAADREGLRPALIYAVMRQESAFDPGANSPAGAYGLLQLIAPTARRLADSLHEPFAEALLLTPDLNLRYGAHYLARLKQQFAGSLPLLAASYNAGPEAVFRWLSAPEKIGMDAFVARIPFAETRNYVERVLSNLAHYEYLAGGPSAVTALDLDLPHAESKPDDLF